MKIIVSKRSILPLSLMTITLAAVFGYYKGMITNRQLLYISFVTTFIIFTLLIGAINRLRKILKHGHPLPGLIENAVKIPKYHVENLSLSANSDLLNKDIIPTSPFRTCVLRIYMELSDKVEQLEISAIRKVETTTTEDAIKIKSVKERKYIIETLARPKETINFRFDKNLLIKNLFIEELYIPR